MVEGNSGDRDIGRSSLHPLELRSKSVTLEGDQQKEDSRSVGTLFNDMRSRAEAKEDRPPQDTAARGKIFHTVEVLSSDHSSDDSFVAIAKSTK
jgi:hypothetical protein